MSALPPDPSEQTPMTATDLHDDMPAPEAKAPAPWVNWWQEVKSLSLLILAVLAFHSFVAKPFYIPSESMMPVLLTGDRLVVSKFPYGWSYVSPSFHPLPFLKGSRRP